MKQYIQRAREKLSRLEEGILELFIAHGELDTTILEQKAEGLKRAVEEGWFKSFLLGGAAVGAGLVYAGTKSDNKYVAGIGYGMLAIDGLYALGCYGIPYLRTLRNRNNTDI